MRDELARIDEQSDHVETDAEARRSGRRLETPGAAFEANDARKHADAMASHRDHIVSTIAELEHRQDELLDKLTASR